MKTIPVSIIVAGLLAPAVSLAQTAGAPKTPVPEGGSEKQGPLRPFLEAWKAADTNHDGFISKEEFDAMPRIQHLSPEKRQHLFDRLDKDGDGKISFEELSQIGKPHDDQKPPMQWLWALDVDKSGGVSFEEFKAGQFIKKLPLEKQLELFRRLDTDHDGQITPADRPVPPFKHEGGKPDGGRMDPRQIFHLLDLNHDGLLSFEEFCAAPAIKDLSAEEKKTRFDALDRNHDGQLTPDEFQPHGEPKHPQGPPPTTAVTPAPSVPPPAK